MLREGERVHFPRVDGVREDLFKGVARVAAELARVGVMGEGHCISESEEDVFLFVVY